VAQVVETLDRRITAAEEEEAAAAAAEEEGWSLGCHPGSAHLSPLSLV